MAINLYNGISRVDIMRNCNGAAAHTPLLPNTSRSAVRVW
jgi:hypothetical protein